MSSNKSTPIKYSSIKQLSFLQHGDKCVELKGYVEEVNASKEVGSVKKYMLFKFVLTNGEVKLNCLVWGKSLIDKYEKLITTRKILHLDGANSKEIKLNESQKSLGFLPFEIIIQANTLVNFLGTHGGDATIEQEPTEANCENVGCYIGKQIVLQAYIKTKISIACSRNGEMTFGSGALTDGTYKVGVQISNVKDSEVNNLEKGTYVKVKGLVRDTGTPSILCNTINSIEVIAGQERMDEDTLLNGVRPPKRKQDFDDQKSQNEESGSGGDKKKSDSLQESLNQSLNIESQHDNENMQTN